MNLSSGLFETAADSGRSQTLSSFAPESRGRESAQGRKLFVGCLPYSKTESDLSDLFSVYGQLSEVALQTTPDGRSKGAAFVSYVKPEDAEFAVNELDGYLFPDSTRGVRVSFATNQSRPADRHSPIYSPQVDRSEEESRGHSSKQNIHGRKLFVGCLPYSKTESDLSELFSVYGRLSEVALQTTADGKSKGAAFVSYVKSEDAECALNGLDGFMFPDSSRSLHVSMATNQSRPGDRHSPSFSGSSATTYSEEPLTPPGFPSDADLSYWPTRRVTTSPIRDLGATKLFVGCLPYSRTSADLSDLFSQFGPLVEVALLTTPENKSKGAAFVTFADRTDAMRALNELQGYTFPNSSRGINVSLATKQSRPVHRQASSPSGSSAAPFSLANVVEEEPRTPPGFSAISAEATLSALQYCPEEILKCLSLEPSISTGQFSILEPDNTDLLRSLFGEETFPPR